MIWVFQAFIGNKQTVKNLHLTMTELSVYCYNYVQVITNPCPVQIQCINAKNIS
jgi:hypothetical protein